LNELANRTEIAVARTDRKISAANTEWRSTKPDFEVLALMARYHAVMRRDLLPRHSHDVFQQVSQIRGG